MDFLGFTSNRQSLQTSKTSRLTLTVKFRISDPLKRTKALLLMSFMLLKKLYPIIRFECSLASHFFISFDRLDHSAFLQSFLRHLTTVPLFTLQLQNICSPISILFRPCCHSTFFISTEITIMDPVLMPQTFSRHFLPTQDPTMPFTLHQVFCCQVSSLLPSFKFKNHIKQRPAYKMKVLVHLRVNCYLRAVIFNASFTFL